MFVQNYRLRKKYLALAIAQGLILGSTAFAEDRPELTLREKELDQLTTITITADPFAPSLLEYGKAASVLTKEDLIRKSQPTLGETLRYEPGVSSSYFGPGSSRPVIRGNAGERVRILRNGVSVGDVSNTSEDHQVGINPLVAEQVEILRGPETLLYGSSAIGGIVNVIDNTIPEQPIGVPFRGEVEYRQGTADDELTGAAVLEGQTGNINWHVNMFHQDTNDVDIPGYAESRALRGMEMHDHDDDHDNHHDHGHDDHDDEHGDEQKGKLANSFTRSKGFSAGGSYVWDEGYIGTSVTGYSSRYGIPGHAHSHEDEHDHDDDHDDDHHDDEEEGGTRIILEKVRADFRGETRNISEAIRSVRYKLAYTDYNHKEVEGDGEVATRFKNDTFEGRVELKHGELGPLEGVVGFQWELSDFNAAGEEAFLPPTDRFSPAVFIFEQLPLDKHWKLQFGGRYEHTVLDAEGFTSDSFNPFGLSTGIVWDPTGKSDYTVGLSVAYTERAPAATELYSDGAHIARQTYEIGDPNLGVESSLGADLTFKKNTGLLTGGLNFFIQDYSDYINLAGTGDIDDGFPVFAYEDISAQFWGFEAQTILHLHELLDLWAHDLDFGVQVDYVRGKNETNSNDLARIPPLRTKVSLRYAWKDTIAATVEGIFVEKQKKTADFELPTDEYQLLNAMLEYNLPIDRDFNLALYVRGENLTDQEARVHSSFIKDLAPLPGRSFLFGARATF